MKKLYITAGFFVLYTNSFSQNVGINTTSPQATLDVKGNLRFGGLSSFIKYDSATGRIEWTNANLYVPVTQALMKHSAAADGLFYNNTAPVSGQLEYRNALGEPVFYTNFTNGNGYFKNSLGIGTLNPGAKLHVVNGASGYSSGYFPGITLEGDNNTYINIITPNNRESGVLFGKASDAAHGGIVYNGTATPNGLQFRTNGNINRMTINGAGNVGIDLLSASEKLEVAGNAKASNFIYQTPKTLYYSLSGLDFNPTNTADTAQFSVGGGETFISSLLPFKQLHAPVHLPHGATMVNMTVYLRDGSASHNLDAVFYRKTHTSNFFPDNIGVVSSSGSGGIAAYSTPVNFLSNVVDNTLYTYYITIGLNPSSGIWGGSSMAVRSMIIEYTLNATQ